MKLSKNYSLSSGLLLLLATGSLQAAGFPAMPTNPYSTMFAPWNASPMGFSPLNNGFTAASPMGMSPFAMSPYGANGSPWGGLPDNVRPWNAWQSGSIMPWASRMPFYNPAGNGMMPNMNGISMPWSGGGMPWGGNNNWMPWSGNGMNWFPGNSANNQQKNRDRDRLQRMMLLDQLNGNPAGLGRMPEMLSKPGAGGMTPAIPGVNFSPALPPVPAAPVPPKPANPFPATNGFPVSSVKSFDPFAEGTQGASLPARPVVPAPPMPPQPVWGSTGDSSSSAYTDPFANDQQKKINDLRFPE